MGIALAPGRSDDLVTLDPLDARPVSRGGVIAALFIGLPVWWALGASGFVQVVAAVPLLYVLVLRGSWRVPRGFLLWLGFCGWMLISAVQVSGLERWLSFSWRASLYLASTVLFLHVYNAPRTTLRTATVVRIMMWFWVLTVLGAVLGILVPNFGWSSPVELLVPEALRSNAFVQALVHPSTTAGNTFAGTSIYRPKAPFIYTNQWGSAYPIVLPFAIAAIPGISSALWRRALIGLIAFSVIPLVVSLDRGAWLSAAIGMAYAVLRLTRGRNRKKAIILAVGGAMIGVIGFFSPLGDLVLLRLDSGHGDDRRLELYESSVESVFDAPILGKGTPVTLEEGDDGPSVGTHGQMWTLLVSNGVPGFALFVGWFAVVLYKTGTRLPVLPGRDLDARFWCHVSVLIAMSQLPYYVLLPWGLPLVMVAAAVGLRESARL